jgi:transcriptional regulator with XRE-family HTH domain
MLSIIETQDHLAELGRRLRVVRVERNETMATFAERIGVSVPTLRAMERGAPSVRIGAWASALWALDRLDDLGAVLAAREGLLDRARAGVRRARQRAYGRRGAPR